MGDYNKGYRTLTVDLKTYELLEEICSIERRKKIDQIRLMVETNQSQQLLELANSKQKSPKLLAEYFIKLGLNTVKFYGADAKVQFDIDNL
jgi:hypothetical protein